MSTGICRFIPIFTLIILATLVTGTPARAAGDGVTAGELVIEPSTLIALGFEWYVDGDENTNGSVSVSYRRQGARDWLNALPLLRMDRADHSGQYGPPVALADRPNLFAGSIFDLDPDTGYEIRLVMSDPDGASGELERMITARTRAEPVPAAGGRVFHVYPPDFKGNVQQPAFIGILAAYYNGRNIAADHYNVYPPRVRAGDTILVHAGLYKDDHHYYATSSIALPASGQISANATCCGATFHGTYHLTADGTADKPIVFRAAGDGDVIFDGDGNGVLFNVMGGDYHYFEGITFRNTQVGIEAGRKGIAGATGLTVKRSRFEGIGQGIHTDWEGSKNFYIADNEFLGRQDPRKLVPWSINIAAGVHGARLAKLGVTREDTMLRSEYAVKVYGSGHVIAFNRARNFHDGFDHATFGVPVDWPKTPRDRMPVANDFYNNDISNVHDDCIEADGNLYNSRVLRNRCINAAGSAISTQGMFGGPTYIVRNLAYHIPGNFAAIKTAGAPGLLIYNNTFVAALRSSFGAASLQSDIRNNLILAGFPEEPAFSFASASGSPTSDYNGYLAGSMAPGAFARIAVPAGGPQVPGLPGPRPETTAFATLAEFAKASGQDRHSRMLDYRVFAQVQPADVDNIIRIYDPASLDFQLRPRGAAIDAGVVLPGVTDGFAGRAPDLGALEAGAALPHYGPRP